MYAEIFGVPASLEEAAKWVQWSQAASRTMAAEGDAGEQNTRYNLGQFWNTKAAAYPAASPEERVGLDRLDWIATQEWGRLADRLQWLTNDPNSRQRYATEAATAYQKAAALAPASSAALAQKRIAEAGTNIRQAQAMAVDSSYSTAFKNAAGDLVSTSILGIPAWAWLAGAAAVVVLLALPSRR